jgi:plasmid stabilization system protein ParE
MVNDSLKLVAKYPYMYRATSYSDVRTFLCNYFKIAYKVADTEIIVLAAFDSRQNPRNNLYESE